MEIQRIKAPDGSEMVVLSADDYDALVAASEDGRDRADARAALASVERDGTIPGDVLKAMLAGTHPVQAWLAYRNMSQVELARRSGLSAVWINRMIKSGSHGSLDTRRKLAKHLNAPVWSLSGEVE